MEYVAIDFQTANKWHKSACSVALVTVKDGKIIDTFYSLIRPGILHFDKENTALHGITKEMVKDAPYFDELWPLIKEKINGKTLVAHYARFDMDVLEEELTGNELAFPSCPVFCTCVLSQAMFPEMPQHRLQDVTEKIGFNIEQRYNAMAQGQSLRRYRGICPESNRRRVFAGRGRRLSLSPWLYRQRRGDGM